MLIYEFHLDDTKELWILLLKEPMLNSKKMSYQ